MKNPDYGSSVINLTNPPKVKEDLLALRELVVKRIQLASEIKDSPLGKNLTSVEDQIGDLRKGIEDKIKAFGSFQDAPEGLYGLKYGRKFNKYNAYTFQEKFPEYPKAITLALDSKVVKALIKGGLITEEELIEKGILTTEIVEVFEITIREKEEAKNGD